MVQLLQSADNDLPIEFYELAFKFIDDNYKLLNLGSGIKFNFERLLKERKKRSYVVSIDIISTKKPDFVDEFYVLDIEKPINFDKKFDVVTAFEVIEHIDNTDILIINAYNNLRICGKFIISFPNIASFWGRLELLLGYQPHMIEVSNKKANFGKGIFGQLNCPDDIPVHHIRGITTKAMKEMLEYYGFKIIKIYGYEWRMPWLFKFLPSIAPVNIFICIKK